MVNKNGVREVCGRSNFSELLYDIPADPLKEIDEVFSRSLYRLDSIIKDYKEGIITEEELRKSLVNDKLEFIEKIKEIIRIYNGILISYAGFLKDMMDLTACLNGKNN